MLTRLPRAVATSLAEHGLTATVTRGVGAAVTILDAPRLSRATFRMGDQDFRYFEHPYNRTLRNERAVEVAVALAFLDRLGDRRDGPGLEVGHVLGHYGITGHAVIDKYEPAHGVDNIDVTDAAPATAPVWIVALSTLEHVGWDESPQTPGKAVAALRHLHGLVAPGGAMLVTTPLGWNPHLDQAIADGLGPDRQWFMARTKWLNRWSEISSPDPSDFPYDHTRRSATALWISEWKHLPGRTNDD